MQDEMKKSVRDQMLDRLEKMNLEDLKVLKQETPYKTTWSKTNTN